MNGRRGSPALAEPRAVRIPPVGLAADLGVPAGARGIVLFAHGSGSSRRSPRNTRVAARLRGSGLATLLFDLLLPDEGADRERVFDIALLAERLLQATRWIRTQDETRRLRLGYFGASTGAAAALVAASSPDAGVSAVVSRGGRPDLAGPALPWVTAPTLLIVGGDDFVVIDLNRQAQAQLRCRSRLEIVPGASHLFVEPGALEAVTGLAEAWFTRHLRGAKEAP